MTTPDSARFRRFAEHSAFQRFSFQHFSFTRIPLFPASGPATGSFNGLHTESKFLAADVQSVMNRVREAELSGSVRRMGDIELNTRSLSEGVFYGMVTDEMADNSRWGADRTEPAAEVTK